MEQVLSHTFKEKEKKEKGKPTTTKLPTSFLTDNGNDLNGI